MSEYLEALHELNDAAYALLRAANNEDGAPIATIRSLCRETDCLLDHGCSVKEFEDAKALYEGAKLAGLLTARKEE